MWDRMWSRMPFNSIEFFLELDFNKGGKKQRHDSIAITYRKMRNIRINCIESETDYADD